MGEANYAWKKLWQCYAAVQTSETGLSAVEAVATREVSIATLPVYIIRDDRITARS